MLIVTLPVCWYILYKTGVGLKIRAVGEFKAGAHNAGISVATTRYVTALSSGLCGGLAGSYLALGVAHIFAEGMVAGRAFIVLAAIVLGNWNPARVAGACLLFGITNLTIQLTQVPSGPVDTVPPDR
jgi:ABC-type uncharacterized transport system permease subunit